MYITWILHYKWTLPEYSRKSAHYLNTPEKVNITWILQKKWTLPEYSNTLPEYSSKSAHYLNTPENVNITWICCLFIRCIDNSLLLLQNVWLFILSRAKTLKSHGNQDIEMAHTTLKSYDALQSCIWQVFILRYKVVLKIEVITASNLARSWLFVMPDSRMH